jgi:hypothetical protein
MRQDIIRSNAPFPHSWIFALAYSSLIEDLPADDEASEL